MSHKMNLFVPITKVDVERRLVYGCLTEEVVDKSGEILDYKTAKPEFEKWSAEIAKNSDGKSLGNVRAMHGNVAAGKLISINFDDDAKKIEGCAKIVDDDEWAKVIEGVYTGFSMGGKYIDRWPDPAIKGVTRFTPEVSEVSIVDLPCVPTATFSMIKADGSTELRKFQTQKGTDMPTNVAPDLEQVWKAKDGSTHATKADAVKKNAEIDAAALAAPGHEALKVEVKEYEDGFEKKAFSDDKRKELAASGKALPDGSYPIESKEDLKNAIEAFGRAKDKAKVKAHIMERAKALGEEAMIPEDWKTGTKAKIATELAKVNMGDAWDASQAMDSLRSILCLLMCERQDDGDSEPEQLAALEMVAEKLKEFIISELKEDEEDDGMSEADKAALAELRKAGARHSAADKAALDEMSDHVKKADKMHKGLALAVAGMHKCMKGLGMEDHESDEGADKRAPVDDPETINKMEILTAEKDALAKALGDLSKSATDSVAAMKAEIESLKGRLKAVEDTPLPPKGKITAVEKGHGAEPPEAMPVEAANTTSIVNSQGKSPADFRAQRRGNM